MRLLAKGFADIAGEYGLPLYTCAETVELSEYGIRHAACIDSAKVERIAGYQSGWKGSRPAPGLRLCGVRGCRRIQYLSQRLHLLLCHHTPGAAAARPRRPCADAPMLTGWPRGGEQITDRTGPSLRARNRRRCLTTFKSQKEGDRRWVSSEGPPKPQPYENAKRFVRRCRSLCFLSFSLSGAQGKLERFAQITLLCCKVFADVIGPRVNDFILSSGETACRKLRFAPGCPANRAFGPVRRTRWPSAVVSLYVPRHWPCGIAGYSNEKGASAR